MKRVLVVGSRGMLGTDLMELLAAEGPLLGLSATGLDLPDIDITNRTSVNRALKEHHPEIVVNCAAFTAVDECEKKLDLAMQVNGIAPGLLAAGCVAARARMIHLSTDFVFDGAKPDAYVEDDPTYPLSAYGATKLEGEQRVLGSGATALIVRTAWLYGAHGKNFVTTIRNLAKTKPELTVVNDQRGCPTWTRDLARALLALMGVRPTGIVHAVGRGTCTWHEFATQIVARSGMSTPVKPISTAQYMAGRGGARRPANSALDTSRLKELTGFEFPMWQTSLDAFLKEIAAT
jgi:dTDP-4-dehydrorhamnose reductase